MKIPEVNEQDLISLLKEPTEPKSEGIQQDDFLNNPETTIQEPKSTEPNPDDFAQPIETEPQQVQEVIVKKPRLSEREYEEQAEISIAFLDSLQTLTLPWLYQQSLFTKDERKKLKELNEKYKKPEVELTKEDQQLLEKYHIYKELSDNVPYTEKEVQLLKGPLAKVFSKYNIQLGPEVLLLSALAYVSAPRYLPLLGKLENLDL